MSSTLAADRRSGLYEATRRGLQSEPRELPTVWLYDARGSRLYEEITRLPEYYLPSREREILRAEALSIAGTRARTLVELGAGSTGNTSLLLDALGTVERFVPLDVSDDALRAGTEAIAAAHPGILVAPLVGDFERDLGALPGRGPRLVAFLGSTIGNLQPARRRAFLERLAGLLNGDDALLVGIDLVKDVGRLRAAYDDRRGVTEAFARNALTAVNRELDATFDQRRFVYDAHWDPAHEWMDIGLRAGETHTVSIPRLDLDLALREGEPIRVEVSSKFRRDGFEQELRRAGLRLDSWWTDPADDFALALATPT
jgi:L-histidine N-alpha-methyltransferase